MLQKVKISKKTIYLRCICIFIIAIIVPLIMVIKANNEKIDYEHLKADIEIESGEAQIVIENERNTQLIEKKASANSDANLEELARKEFNFIKGDEIIIKPQKKNKE